MSRHDVITVTLEEPLNEEYVEKVCDGIEMFDAVTGADPGRTNNMELVQAKRQLRQEMWEVLKE